MEHDGDTRENASWFWGVLKKSKHENGCWLWVRASHERGYGRVRWDGRIRAAHRVAWNLSHDEELRDSDLVLHQCDTPACCRPDHLYIGTHRDNAQDRVARSKMPERSTAAVSLSRARSQRDYWQKRIDDLTITAPE